MGTRGAGRARGAGAGEGLIRYPNILRFLAEWPWAIMPGTLEAILEVVDLRADGRGLSEEEIQARIGLGAATRPTARAVGAIQVLPLYGVIAPRINVMTQISGGTSAQKFGAELRAAVDNPDVSAIVIDGDTPGGSVFLIEETAAVIRDARGRKPIVAVANTLAASAGYWLLAQADELIVSPSSQVGSIGVAAIHVDTSEAEERAGIKTHVITTAKFKGEGFDGAPLSDEARAAILARAQQYHRVFVADVARGRGVSQATVEADFGEGRVVSARDAVRIGMADGIGTLDQVIERLAAGRKRVAAALAGAPDPAPIVATEPEARPAAVAPDAGDDRAAYRLALAGRGL